MTSEILNAVCAFNFQAYNGFSLPICYQLCLIWRTCFSCLSLLYLLYLFFQSLKEKYKNCVYIYIYFLSNIIFLQYPQNYLKCQTFKKLWTTIMNGKRNLSLIILAGAISFAKSECFSWFHTLNIISELKIHVSPPFYFFYIAVWWIYFRLWWRADLLCIKFGATTCFTSVAVNK